MNYDFNNAIIFYSKVKVYFFLRNSVTFDILYTPIDDYWIRVIWIQIKDAKYFMLHFYSITLSIELIFMLLCFYSPGLETVSSVPFAKLQDIGERIARHSWNGRGFSARGSVAVTDSGRTYDPSGRERFYHHRPLSKQCQEVERSFDSADPLPCSLFRVWS